MKTFLSAMSFAVSLNSQAFASEKTVKKIECSQSQWESPQIGEYQTAAIWKFTLSLQDDDTYTLDYRYWQRNEGWMEDVVATNLDCKFNKKNNIKFSCDDKEKDVEACVTSKRLDGQYTIINDPKCSINGNPIRGAAALAKTVRDVL